MLRFDMKPFAISPHLFQNLLRALLYCLLYMLYTHLSNMASDVRLGVPPTLKQTGLGGGDTVNLVQLLREAEEGKGLGIDYGEALGEALGYDCGRDTPTRSKKGLALARIPSTGRKR